MTRAPALITAAVVFGAALSLAASARADAYSNCRMVGSVAGLAMMQRAHGASQYEAAATSGAIISEVVNASDADYTVRLYLADRLASVSTTIIQLVYSVPMTRDAPAWMWSEAAEQAAFNLCIDGDL